MKLKMMTKKRNNLTFPLFVMVVLLTIASGCTNDDVAVLTTLTVTEIKEGTAKSGGNITSDGGVTIIERGVCWSTNPNPTISDNKTTDGGGVGEFVSSITGLSPNTTYYLRAYAANSNGTSYGNEISFNSGPTIGSIYAGGIVFYLDGEGHGLVCAENDYTSSLVWGCNGTTIGGTSTAFNTGAANTNAIVAGCSETGAANICYNLTLNNYSDWYLPSIDELNIMNTNLNLHGLGNFDGGDSYWSSSEQDNNYSWMFTFGADHMGCGDKSYTLKVRPIRAF
jgi:hypothetical protein